MKALKTSHDLIKALKSNKGSQSRYANIHEVRRETSMRKTPVGIMTERDASLAGFKEACGEKAPVAPKKNKKQVVLKSKEKKSIEDIIQRIAKQENIDELDSVRILLTEDSCIINFK